MIIETLLRVGGTAVGVVGAVAIALWSAFLTPLYAGTVRLPVAVVVAVVGNYALVWFTHRATGHKLLALLPGLVWMGIMIVFSARTTEGDIVLAGDNWVGLLTIVGGVAAYVFCAYRMINSASMTNATYADLAREPRDTVAEPCAPPSAAGPPVP